MKVKEDNDTKYEAAEQQSIEELISFIRNELIPCPDVVSLVDLIERFVASMKSRGFNNARSFTKKHLGRLIKSKLQETVHIVQNQN